MPARQLASADQQPMLKLKPNCEHCDADLPPDSTAARICSYECTFCASCVEQVLANVCPNCGGGLERRPVRPGAMLVKHPASTERYRKPVDTQAHARLRERYESTPPSER